MVPTTLRQMSGKHRSESGDTRLGVVLAWVAGAVNAGGFVAVGTYTSHMSGMVSSLADLVVLHHWLAAGLAGLHVLAFFSGSVAATLMIRGAQQFGLNSQFAIALMAEALLLLGFGALAAAGIMSGLAGLQGLIALLCLIMGMQNGLITKISHAEIRTTHMTGVITDLGIEVGRWIFGAVSGTPARPDATKVRRLGALLTGFLSGGIVGAVAFSGLGYVSVVPIAVLLMGLAILPIADDLAQLGRR